MTGTTLSAPETTWTVYHGGSLLGLGRWSGPHATEAAAEASARECVQVVGGEPTIEREVQS